MKITFVNLQKGMFPPIGMCYLSAYIKKYMPETQTNMVELLYGETPDAAAKAKGPLMQ